MRTHEGLQVQKQVGDRGSVHRFAQRAGRGQAHWLFPMPMVHGWDCWWLAGSHSPLVFGFVTAVHQVAARHANGHTKRVAVDNGDGSSPDKSVLTGVYGDAGHGVGDDVVGVKQVAHSVGCGHHKGPTPGETLIHT